MSEPSPSPAYLAGLNPPQRAAVTTLDGPLLVLAGAGTGKTRVLTTRLAHLIHSRRAWPSQILCVTFTNKAAREMQERIGAIIDSTVEAMPWLGTFHSVAARILRRHAELAGLKSNFSILDTDDQLRLLKQIILAADIDEKRWNARTLASMIDGWKNRGLGPDQLSPGDGSGFANGRGRELYQAYQARLISLNACDFGDLLLHNIRIFQNNPELLGQYQERFRYLLVDEYQDTNVAQYLWLRLLAQKHKNICCVGDDDQSIYGWRGAEVGNILRFEQDFPGAQVIRLEQNYRSTSHILAAASALIARNQGRFGKTLWCDHQAGAKVEVRALWDGMAEAQSVCTDIATAARNGEPLAQIAILVRTTSQMRLFEDRLLSMGLPYRVVGGPRFYERKEIRDALAYLRLVAQPDDDLAFERIVNSPKRGIGEQSLAHLRQQARVEGKSLLNAARAGAGIPARARASLAALVGDFDRWRDGMAVIGHQELAGRILEESGYRGMWVMEKTPDAQGRVENLGELVKATGEFDTLTGFLEHVALVMENDAGAGLDRAVIMTLHGAKGLEFDRVYLAGWEEGLFPNQRALDESGLAGLEEERRLAYVGLTRARKQAVILHAANRLLYGKWQAALPSRFIAELPLEDIEVKTAPGLFGGAQPRPAAAPRHVSRFAVGDRVSHAKFGEGTVLGVDGEQLLIGFDTAGDRRVIDSFIRAA